MYAKMTPRWTKLYIGLIIALGGALLARGLWDWQTSNPGQYLSYLAIALVASILKIKIPSVTGSMSLNFLFVLIGISSFSLGETMVMGCLGTIVQTFFQPKSRPNWLRVGFNVASMATAIQAAFWMHHAGEVRSEILTAVAFFVANTLQVAIVIALTESKNIWSVWRESYFWTFPNYLVGAAAAWVVSVASARFGWQPALLLMPIFYVVYRSHSLYIAKLEEAQRRVEEQRAHAKEIAALQRRSIETLALAVEAKDQTTHAHLGRVEVYAVEVAKELGLPEAEIEALRSAALLHDIGKLAIPEYIISKPGKLTPEEFERMKTHTVVGGEIVERIRFPYAVAPMVRGHHEKWNGTGYPDGLAGEAIPIGARILAAVDTLDALASDRQYRRAMPLDRAIEIIVSESGKAFDPKIVDILARRYRELDELAKSSEGIQQLPTEVRVERGDAPAAGFEKVAADLMHIHHSIADFTSLATCVTRDQLWRELGESLSAAVPHRALTVYVRHGDFLSPEFVSGNEVSARNVRIGEGLSGWVAENRKAIVNGNPSVEPGLHAGELVSAIAVPLESETGVVGVLALYSDRENSFGNLHLESLTRLGPILAAALGNAGQRVA